MIENRDLDSAFQSPSFTLYLLKTYRKIGNNFSENIFSEIYKYRFTYN